MSFLREKILANSNPSTPDPEILRILISGAGLFFEEEKRGTLRLILDVV
jgi:hypothetical protein